MGNQFAPAPGVTAEELDDGICLYRSETNEVLVLNQTAADIWRLVTEDLEVSQVTTQLASAYRTTPAALSDDVWNVIRDLVTKGYLHELADDPNPAA